MISQPVVFFQLFAVDFKTAMPPPIENLSFLKFIFLKVELVSKVDQDIIGGFILRLGDQQFDASVANQLQSLEHKLSNRKALA